jgi:ribosomal protein L37AE/L43A
MKQDEDRSAWVIPAREASYGGKLWRQAMEDDFVYCPRCRRYSIVHWCRGIGQWECEDCTYKFGKEDDPSWAVPATVGA